MNKGLNKVMLIGWVDGQPEVRHTPTGRPVATFSLATSRSWTSSEGEHHEETEWFNIVAWGNLAEICEKRVGHDEHVYVEGRLQTGRSAATLYERVRPDSPAPPNWCLRQTPTRAGPIH